MNDTLFASESNLHADASSAKRKNKPEELKHGLIMAAKHLMVSDGVVNLSMQKVADAAGTSKGGLFHHFKNKEELLNAVVGLYIAQLNTAILSITDELGDVQGRFTKAYLQVIFQNPEIGLNSNWSGLLKAIHADAIMFEIWQNWMAQKQKQFAATDSHAQYQVVRYAIEGAQLDSGLKSDQTKQQEIYENLASLI
ncbi:MULTISPECIES: TetR/AcrR family transcriptional regulator [Moraxella]|uniref:Transcriptional regulator, TetR family n=1 Tax=Moraxella catarrhalis TaxID=480 RepID=A0A7Z1A4V6_MORCA|nr:TetR/AcrR family transcriptional regulator [Moraxella catarrhalis]OAV02116.1 Transcriptional regulator, TetR family [Moraxella catarrhalis]STY81988.1 DNA-binding transcriptional repressor AcrR [Moraxella catarrhalis]